MLHIGDKEAVMRKPLAGAEKEREESTTLLWQHLERSYCVGTELGTRNLLVGTLLVGNFFTCAVLQSCLLVFGFGLPVLVRCLPFGV